MRAPSRAEDLEGLGTDRVHELADDAGELFSGQYENMLLVGLALAGTCFILPAALINSTWLISTGALLGVAFPSS